MFNLLILLLNKQSIKVMTIPDFNYRIDQIYPNLKAYTYKFTSDNEEASDLIQDTILKAMSNREKYRSNTNFKAWVYTIMKNTFINNYRRQVKYRDIVNSKQEFHNLYSDTRTMTSPHEIVIYKELKQHLASLKDVYRIPFQRFVDGFKYHEIAEELKIPIGTVKTRIHQARKLLATKVNIA